MDDLRPRFANLDALAVPDLWTDIERRASQPTELVRPMTTWRGQSGRRALPTMLLAVVAGLLVAVVAGGILIGRWLDGPMPTAAGSTVPTTTVLGCILQQGERSVGAQECESVAAQIVAHLPQNRGTPFAMTVSLFSCPTDAACRWPDGVWDGRVTVEYADGGNPIELRVAGLPGEPRFEEVTMTWSGLREPSSSRVDASGPFSFTLGHCGLTWFVDFDGSFWVPVGLVDGRASAIVNAEQGEMLLLGPNLVQFRGESGFTAQLARFPGPKHVWICA